MSNKINLLNEMKMPNKIRTNIVLDRELWRKTRIHALEQEISASKIINILLEEYLDKRGDKK